MLDDDLYRLVVRARIRWRRAEPACSNEAAAEAAGRPLFGEFSEISGIPAYDNPRGPLAQFSDASEPLDKSYQP